MQNSNNPDEWLYGWDPTPGIVSVWADHDGRAVVWRRVAGQVICETERYQPWVFARTLSDLGGLRGDAHIHYRRLAGGGPRDYRYILSASNYRTLERTITAGASRRLGIEVSRLAQLDDYYPLGPAEQYLIQSGRTYFWDMRYANLHRLQLDIFATDLDPHRGRIFMVGVRDTLGLEQLFEAPTPGGEAGLIRRLAALIRERDPDILEGYNLCGQDLPYLAERARLLGVPLELGRLGGKAGELVREELPASHYHRARIRYSVAGREIIDLLPALWRHDAAARNMPGYGLNQAAGYFGIANPHRTPINNAVVYDRFHAHPARVRLRAAASVREVDELSQLLMPSYFELAQMAPRPYSRVATAGPAMGILEPMLVRAYYHAGAALPRSADLDDPELRRSRGGASYLFAGGLAKHVVKCDVASMYPSIMVKHNIGPASDHLGVLVSLVGSLMTQRLEYKRAGRVATSGSGVARAYQARAAGLKIIINSAYGYLAAGRMALFADVDAADAITDHSRVLLDQVINGLRSRGATPLEADIDGVFFALAAHYSEADERALVREVAKELPEGIKLEYDGRYRAMLSHEIKNYALLGYDGKVIIRGSGLRNSQSPPFAARFLADALEYLLCGDVVEVVALYRAALAGLRHHRFSLRDVATTTRLTKSAADYQMARRRAREGQYEALLAAGRTSWQPGERVRYYRAGGGRYIWLPFDSDELSDGELHLEGGSLGLTEHSEWPAYDASYYIRLLRDSYLSRLRKAFRDDDYRRLFRENGQRGIFDQPTAEVVATWIEVEE